MCVGGGGVGGGGFVKEIKYIVKLNHGKSEQRPFDIVVVKSEY